jgi:gamma-glutamyl phosphate reductase
MTSAKPQSDGDQLKPNDFPLESDQDKIKRQDGKPVAKTESDEMAEDMTDRLNCDEHRREEDRWSA